MSSFFRIKREENKAFGDGKGEDRCVDTTEAARWGSRHLAYLLVSSNQTQWKGPFYYILYSYVLKNETAKSIWLEY